MRIIRHFPFVKNRHPNLDLLPVAPLHIYCVMGEDGAMLADDNYGPPLGIIISHAKRLAERFNQRVYVWESAWPWARDAIDALMMDDEPLPWVRALEQQAVWGARGAEQALWDGYDARTGRYLFSMPEMTLPVYCVLANEGEGIFTFRDTGPRLTLDFEDAKKCAAEFDGKVMVWEDAWPQVREMIAETLDDPVDWLCELKAQLLSRN